MTFPLIPRSRGRIYTPDEFAALVVWLKADVGLYTDSAGTIPAVNDGDVIGRWLDQSGQGNYFLQATGAKKCLLQNAAGDLVNGLPVIRSDGVTNNYRCLSNTLQASAGNVTVYMVSQRLFLENEHDWQRAIATELVGIEDTTAPAWAILPGIDGDGHPQIYAPTISRYSSGNAIIKTLWLFDTPYGEDDLYEFQGDIMEVLIYEANYEDGSTIDRRIRAYLNDRWGIE